MSFQSVEESRDEATPVYLYLFKYGPEIADAYAYTNAELPVFWDGGLGENEYLPTTITHTEITSSGTMDKSTVTVTTANDGPLADQLGGSFSSVVVAVVIYKGHHDTPAPEYKLEWVGKVSGAVRNGNEIAYPCVPASLSLKRKGLRKNSQKQCQKALYGPTCRKDITEVTSEHFAIGVSGSLITLPPAWNVHAPALKYESGLIWWFTPEGRKEMRSIIRVDGDELLASAPATGAVVGTKVYIAPGCNHFGGLEDDCEAIHNNSPNFGGSWWLPAENPFGIKNGFY